MKQLTGDTENDDAFYTRVGAIVERTGKPHIFIGFDGCWCMLTTQMRLEWLEEVAPVPA